MALTLAIDLGTTNLKVGIVDEQGDILIVRSSPLQTGSSEPGAAEPANWIVDGNARVLPPTG